MPVLRGLFCRSHFLRVRVPFRAGEQGHRFQTSLQIQSNVRSQDPAGCPSRVRSFLVKFTQERYRCPEHSWQAGFFRPVHAHRWTLSPSATWGRIGSSSSSVSSAADLQLSRLGDLGPHPITGVAWTCRALVTHRNSTSQANTGVSLVSSSHW